MGLGNKLSACRGFTFLLLVGVVFFTANLMLLWGQLHHQQVLPGASAICECRDKNSVARTDYELLSPSGAASQTHQTHSNATVRPSVNHTSSSIAVSHPSNHMLAVVVPFRDRFEEMLQFAPHIHRFLSRQDVDHRIWVINQVDSHRFNRASLLNIGFLLSRNECDYMVMHDIDLLPSNDHLKYEFPSKGPFHVSSPELHPLYHYKTFVGGILMMSREQFEKVNGLSNLFWGWGREDDELYVRMKEAGMKVHYPQGITTGYKTFVHIHDKHKRPRDQKRYENQWDMSRRRDRKTGVNSVQYKVVSTVKMVIDDAPLNFVNVELECDHKITPFCDDPS